MSILDWLAAFTPGVAVGLLVGQAIWRERDSK